MQLYNVFTVITAAPPAGGGGGDEKYVEQLFSALIDAAKESPYFIWIALPAVGVLTISLLVPQALGRFGKAATEWADRRRRASAADDDYQISDLSRQREYLKGQIQQKDDENNTLRDKIGEWERVTQVHVTWDWEARQEIIKTDPHFPMPPPLRPENKSKKDDGV